MSAVPLQTFTWQTVLRGIPKELQNKHCLTPEKCKNLHLGYEEGMRLYGEILTIEGKACFS